MSLYVKGKERYDLNILCQFQHQPALFRIHFSRMIPSLFHTAIIRSESIDITSILRL